MSEQRPYRRPMDPKWWAKPPYLNYTLRELSGVAVLLYGAILFIGLIALAGGKDSFATFLGFLRNPATVLLHFILLAGVIYHVVTWFETLPKTQPKMIVNGKQVPPEQITKVATLIAAGCSLVLVLFTMVVAR